MIVFKKKDEPTDSLSVSLGMEKAGTHSQVIVVVK